MPVLWRIKISFHIAASVLIAAASNAVAQQTAFGELVEYSTPVGARAVNPSQLWNYEARWVWTQLDGDPDSVTHGELAPFGEVIETMTHDRNRDWRHIQTHYREDGTVVEQRRVLDGATLQPIRVDASADPSLAGYKEFATVFRHHAYRGEAIRADGEIEAFNSQTEVPAFSGWISGVVIRALPLKLGYRASLPTTNVLSRTDYKLWIEVVGEDIIETIDGRNIEVWNVEAGWHDLNSNDVYRQGSGYRGGLFQIAKTAAADVPYVVNYVSSQTKIFWTGQKLEDQY